MGTERSATGDGPASAPVSLPDVGDAVSVRRAVVALAASLVEPVRLADFEVAVAEVVTNALVHGRRPVDVTISVVAESVVVVVHDEGPGPTDPRVGLAPPAATQTAGGFGVWIARNWSDTFEIARDATGCRVILSVAARAGG